jgi:hypothetical protein
VIRFGTVLNPFVCSEWLRFWPGEQAKSKKGRDDDSEHPQIWIFLKILKVGSKNMIRGGRWGSSSIHRPAGAGTVLTM